MGRLKKKRELRGQPGKTWLIEETWGIEENREKDKGRMRISEDKEMWFIREKWRGVGRVY